MTEIVNLNRVRKAKQRQRAAEVAQENRVRHGRTAVAKLCDKREVARQAASLDGKRSP